MKRIILFSLLLSAVLFASCTRDNVKDIYSPESVTPSILSMNGTSSFEIPAMVSDTTLTLSSNVWWDVQATDDAEWCSYTIDGIQMGYTPFHFTLVPNITDEDRVFNITLKAADPVDYTQTFVLTQKCTLEKFAVSQDIASRIDPSIDAILMPKLQGTIPFEMTTNAVWKIVTSESWCQVTGSDTGQPGINIPVEILCESNPTNDYREATVSIETEEGVVLMEFKIVQSNIFEAPVLTITNNDQKLSASWTATDGVSGYGVVIYDSLSVKLTEVTVASNVLELDMTDFASATGLTNYVGQISVTVKALTPDPTVYEESEPIVSNSHFADNGGNGMNASSRFRISNIRHLNNLSVAYPKGFFYYLLNYNMDLTGQPMPQIGTATAPFVGDFDGGSANVRSIANSLYEPLTTNISASSFVNYGFFAVVGNRDTNVSKIANMNFKSCTLTLPDFSAINRAWALCVGLNKGATLSNINMTDCKIAFNVRPAGAAGTAGSPAANIGMIAGTQTGGRMTKCTTTGGEIGRLNEVFASNNNALGLSIGGIVGLAGGGAVIDSCANVSTPVGSYMSGGGVIGLCDASLPIQVIQCYNKATVTATTGTSGGGVGGLIGGITASAVGELQIDHCWNSGDVGYLQSGGTSRMGGIIGDSQSATATLTMKQCFNSGHIYYYYPAGGSLTGMATRVLLIGGLGGTLVSNQNGVQQCVISDCYNAGAVTLEITGFTGAVALFASGNGGVGGIGGWINGGNTDTRGYVRNTYNSGEVKVLLTGASSVTVNAVGVLFGRSTSTQGQQPFSNLVYTSGKTSVESTPVTAITGAFNGTATAYTDGFYEFTDFSSQAAFEGLNDNGNSYDFANIWEMGAGYPILRGLYGNPAQ